MQHKSKVDAGANLAQIEAHLATSWLGKSQSPNEFWPSIDSTNNRALELAGLGAQHGVIVVADQQTAGRGRSGRTWLSPAGTGIYMSFLLRPKVAAANLPIMTLLSGVAVAQAIQGSLGIKIGLKWVNDLIVQDKKVGGILAEYQRRPQETKDHSTARAAGDALVIGIGLNLRKPDLELPVELKNKIGFLESHLPTDQIPIDGNKLVAAIANELESVLDQAQLADRQLDGALSILDRWRAYSITLGEEIIAIIGDKQIQGQALDITNSGELIVKTISGNITLPAGEVTIRKPDGSYV